MELTEICGNIQLCFKDFTFGLPVCATAEHSALLDAESGCGFDTVYSQYYKLFDTATALHNAGKDFELYLSVVGYGLSGPLCGEPQSLYYCHVQSWNNRLAVELYLYGKKKLIRQECFSSESAIKSALNFVFGGFVFTCFDFNFKEINLKEPCISEALELYCLADDKQLLLNELLKAY